MTLPISTSIKSRGLSRRDHVLNLLPPLTVVNKEDATMHERLFSDDPPPKTYPENFPSKVLRHLGAWTFYSAPTKGELALLDKNMYDLENEEEIPEKTDAEGKKHSTLSTENMKEHGTLYHKHTPRIQSHCASDDKKRLETRKGKTLRTNKEKQIQQINEEEKVLPQKETSDETKQEKACLTPESTQREYSAPNSIEKAKQQVSGNRNNNVETTKKVTKRRSPVTRATKKLQKNTQVKSRLQAPLANVEISLKKSRGKVLGGAETGAEISTEPLTVEGHNMSVPGHDRHNGTRDVERAGDNINEKLNTTERKNSRVSKRNGSSSCDTCSADLDRNDNEKTTASDETQVKRSVIQIPLQENDSSVEAENNNRAITPGGVLPRNFGGGVRHVS